MQNFKSHDTYFVMKQIPNIQDILIKNQRIAQIRRKIETVNFRIYFEVIFRQNEIQYFAALIYLQCWERARIVRMGEAKRFT